MYYLQARKDECDNYMYATSDNDKISIENSLESTFLAPIT